MGNLFNLEGGFRLNYIELYNWGTFHEKVYRLTLDGKNSLLTGANGSGKTTLVDALLTLLVPQEKRHYNQSSGAERKKERNEQSYFLGAYGNVQENEGQVAKALYLRPDKQDYSVILGTFFNQEINQYLTLVQVRWYSGTELRRVFAVCHEQLNIVEDINPFDHRGDWKKRLGKFRKIKFFDSFSQYSQYFASEFGLKAGGEQALNLFAQTVGIKVLGNLNEFIRTNMLEGKDVESEFKGLQKNFEDLMSAYRQIEKAKKQLELLEPIIKLGGKLDLLQDEERNFLEAKEVLPGWFADREAHLLKIAIAKLEENLLAEQSKLGGIKHSLRELQDQKIRIEVAKSKDSIGNELEKIEAEIKSLLTDLDIKKKKLNDYNSLCRILRLPIDPDEQVFRSTRLIIREKVNELLIHKDSLDNKWSDAKSVLATQENEYKEQADELESLRLRKNQIPRQNLDLRTKICDALGIEENDLPFIGELIKVKDEEREWSGAIENVLHNFGLRLLVPSRNYQAVNSFIDKNHLGQRIIYHHVEAKQPKNIFTNDSKDLLPDKILIKSDTEFYDWIEYSLYTKFNFVCCLEEEFPKFSRAITINGLSKNKDRHEKDDRPHRLSAANYILGWSNQEKIEIFQRELREKDSQIKESISKVEELRNLRQSTEQELNNLNLLKSFEHFADLDWKSISLSIDKKQSRRNHLLASSNQLRELEKQLGNISGEINAQEELQEIIQRLVYSHEAKLKEYKPKLDTCNQVLLAFNHINIQEFAKKLTPFIEKIEFQLEEVSDIRLSTETSIQDKLSQLISELHTFEKKLIGQMNAFVNPKPEILALFASWTGDTQNLEPELHYIDEYRQLYQHILVDDLPRLQHRFKSWLNERLVHDIVHFNAYLNDWEHEIKGSIRELNVSLRQIPFCLYPSTYIELEAQSTKDSEIGRFRQELREAIPNAAFAGDEQTLEASFHSIRSIIGKLNDERFRKKVTDVRNWLNFAAVERYEENDKQHQYYQDSQSLSGGEKAKLAYTILASAIAYQFNINDQQPNAKSFRFVVVDEAFSKVDPENSKYAMELFNRLNLQLMVVTPLDRINLVENYINSVHFTENKNRSRSAVHHFSLQEYQEKRGEWSKSLNDLQLIS